ncbi:cell envelope biogenesis protein OmpA [Rodentibacter trehalosifermentans]|uniref:Cell envelope biogenesis protein OmpA n=1 Tax=Rodentibacter trehalosifermentans TaxID=1908263 RepID=A0A1V3J304_9PAST|nr:OmpA family protein [Rodentibacter trehalosifermentans]OOF49486.1 cell envelope biogenesis protein OmpA [Rodentibacter trehalosifermentans]
MPISDLMSGLMILFLFIAVSLMRNAFQERDKVKEVAIAYQENQVAIYQVLMKEFEQDLAKWNADIEQDTLTFVFKSPDVLFETGKYALNEQYKMILRDFFPRYMNTIYQYQDSISEIRIEGHTSSIWNTKVSEDQAYFYNMQLSQDRTRAVLQYIYHLDNLPSKYHAWIKSHIAAVGLSSSKPIIENNSENQEKSRRVTFRIITNADIKIKQILEN